MICVGTFSAILSTPFEGIERNFILGMVSRKRGWDSNGMSTTVQFSFSKLVAFLCPLNGLAFYTPSIMCIYFHTFLTWQLTVNFAFSFHMIPCCVDGLYVNTILTVFTGFNSIWPSYQLVWCILHKLFWLSCLAVFGGVSLPCNISSSDVFPEIRTCAVICLLILNSLLLFVSDRRTDRNRVLIQLNWKSTWGLWGLDWKAGDRFWSWIGCRTGRWRAWRYLIWGSDWPNTGGYSSPSHSCSSSTWEAETSVVSSHKYWIQGHAWHRASSYW